MSAEGDQGQLSPPSPRRGLLGWGVIALGAGMALAMLYLFKQDSTTLGGAAALLALLCLRVGMSLISPRARSER